MDREDGDFLEFSPNGQFLIIYDDSGIRCVRQSIFEQAESQVYWGENFALESRLLIGSNFIGKRSEISPDGRRRVTVESDYLLRFSDASTGRQLADISFDAAVSDIQFTPNGDRLLIDMADGRVRVWDSREPAARHKDRLDRLAIRAAAEPDVERILAGPTPTDQLENSVRARDDLTPLHRLVMLELLRPRMNAIEREADSIFSKLKERHMNIGRVTAAARSFAPADSMRDGPRVKAAVEKLAAAWNPSASELDNIVWSVARSPDASVEALSTALETAREAERMAALTADLTFNTRANTLGVALYRHGDYAEAKTSLEESERQYAMLLSPGSRPVTTQRPVNLAFLAMSEFKLGRQVEAREKLNTLRKLMLTKKGANSHEAWAFLKEAEALIEGPTTPESAPAPVATSGPSS